MTKYTCKACGVQQSSTHAIPGQCPICKDDRQNIPAADQQWLILAQHYNKHEANWTQLETGIHQLPTSFDCGIGQDAHLIQTKNGNYLWDCVPLISDEWVDKIHAMGGLKSIVISHPHFYSNAACWSANFGNIPIYIHHNDKIWVQDMSDNILFWQGETLRLEDDLTIINCGGHFDGSCVLHWSGASDGKSVIFAGDTINPMGGANAKQVIFRHSFSRKITLPAHKVSNIGRIMSNFSYERLYGAFRSRIINNADKITQDCIAKHTEALA